MLPDALAEVVEIVRAAYPEALSGDEYLAVLAVLSEGMSHENLGIVVTAVTGRDEALVVNDTAAVLSGTRVDPKIVSKVASRLAEHGWDADD